MTAISYFDFVETQESMNFKKIDSVMRLSSCGRYRILKTFRHGYKKTYQAWGVGKKPLGEAPCLAEAKSICIEDKENQKGEK